MFKVVKVFAVSSDRFGRTALFFDDGSKLGLVRNRNARAAHELVGQYVEVCYGEVFVAGLCFAHYVAEGVSLAVVGVAELRAHVAKKFKDAAA